MTDSNDLRACASTPGAEKPPAAAGRRRHRIVDRRSRLRQQRLRDFRERGQQQWETDYSRLLVFVCGNLDEMYEGLATSVDDCDSDADIFHALTGRLSVIDVKQALNKRFKPEQVARLGNEHVIYPSLSRRAYEQLIEQGCARYARETEARCGLRFELAASVREQIYANAVFPAQGSRPLFSSLHAILGTGLAKAALWALELGAEAGDSVGLTADGRSLVAQWRGRSQAIAAPFEISRLRQRNNADFRALLAVHEAGHGLVHALLFGRAPQEIKIHVASFEGGYNAYSSRTVWSRRNLLDSICTSLAGRAAELLVFGPELSSSGARSARGTCVLCLQQRFDRRVGRVHVGAQVVFTAGGNRGRSRRHGLRRWSDCHSRGTKTRWIRTRRSWRTSGLNHPGSHTLTRRPPPARRGHSPRWPPAYPRP
jgi:hypothetical protein